MSLGLSVNYHIACPQNRGSLQISAVQGKPLRSSSGVVAKKQQRFTGGGIGVHRYELSSVLLRFLPQPFQKGRGQFLLRVQKHLKKTEAKLKQQFQGFFRL